MFLVIPLYLKVIISHFILISFLLILMLKTVILFYSNHLINFIIFFSHFLYMLSLSLNLFLYLWFHFISILIISSYLMFTIHVLYITNFLITLILSHYHLFFQLNDLIISTLLINVSLFHSFYIYIIFTSNFTASTALYFSLSYSVFNYSLSLENYFSDSNFSYNILYLSLLSFSKSSIIFYFSFFIYYNSSYNLSLSYFNYFDSSDYFWIFRVDGRLIVISGYLLGLTE